MALSELEGVILGVVWREGPCSPYVVKREFEQSPSSSWSASAGAIYPAITKLEAHGLLSSREEAWRGRTRRLVRLTARGRTALRAWLSDLPDWTGRVTSDPIRARAHFLDLLPDQDGRLAFLATAEANTRQAITELDALDGDRPEYERLATLGSRLQLRARLQWIRVARRVIQRGEAIP